MGEQPTTAANAIELRIEEISQLFHTLDPFPFREKDLDADAEDLATAYATPPEIFGGIALPGEAAFASLTPIKVFRPKWHIFVHRLLRRTGSTEAAPPTA